MPEAVKQITRPAITSSAVLVNARHEAGPMRRTAVNGQKRHQHGKSSYRQRKGTPVAFDQAITSTLRTRRRARFTRCQTQSPQPRSYDVARKAWMGQNGC